MMSPGFSQDLLALAKQRLLDTVDSRSVGPASMPSGLLTASVR